MTETKKQATPYVTIVNPTSLPIYTQESKKLYDNVATSRSLFAVRSSVKQLVKFLEQKNYGINEVVVKIEEKDPKACLVEFIPKFKTFYFSHYISGKNIEQISTINFPTSFMKNVKYWTSWNYRKSYFKNALIVNGNNPWKMKWFANYGQPLNEEWVADCKKFKFEYNYQDYHTLYFENKGYENRVKSQFSGKRQIYSNSDLLRNQDLFQIGLRKQKFYETMNLHTAYSLAYGTDFKQSKYVKLKGDLAKVLMKNQSRELYLKMKCGFIGGSNVPIQEMYDRNPNKWLNERSKMFANARIGLKVFDTPLFAFLNIIAENYMQFWVSKNSTNKVKLEGELGISFQVHNTNAKFDFSLFRFAGVKGEPRFGLKYEF